MDITSPFLLKLKGALFAFLGLLAGAVLLAPIFSWQALGLFLIAVWAFCRAYYFCFYVLHHYVRSVIPLRRTDGSDEGDGEEEEF
ncbi:MAG: hypothetical protein QM755_01445 [Luteolibacter sp.]